MTEKATEKIWELLQEIDTARELTAKSKKIKLPLVPHKYWGEREHFTRSLEDRERIFPMLESKKALENVKETKTQEGDGDWTFKIATNYQEVFNEYKKEFEKIQRKKKLNEKKATTEPIYEIKFNELTREILINNFLLGKPDFAGENELVFSYLYKNANKRFSKKKLQEDLRITINKSFHKIVENLGFRGNMKKVFFSISKNAIEFRNPINKEMLKKADVTHLRIPKD